MIFYYHDRQCLYSALKAIDRGLACLCSVKLQALVRHPSPGPGQQAAQAGGSSSSGRADWPVREESLGREELLEADAEATRAFERK